MFLSCILGDDSNITNFGFGVCLALLPGAEFWYDRLFCVDDLEGINGGYRKRKSNRSSSQW